MNDIVSKQENIEKQLTEIELISSIYSNSNEFVIEDPEAITEGKLFLTSRKLPERRIGYIIRFNVEISENVNNYQKETENEKNYIQVMIKKIILNFLANIYLI